MNLYWEQMQTAARFAVVVLGLMATPPLSANEPRLLVTLTGHTTSVKCLAFSPDGKTLASSDHSTICLWDVTRGKTTMTIRQEPGFYGVFSLAFSADGKTLASATSEASKVWEVRTGKEITSIAEGPNWYACMALTPDGKTLALPGSSECIEFWSVASGKKTRVIQEERSVCSLVFSPDGKRLASWGFSGPGITSAEDWPVRPKTIRIWEVSSSKMISVFPSNVWAWGHCIAFSPDGKTLAAPTTNATIKLWEVGAPKEKLTLPVVGNNVNCLAFSPDRKTLASAGRPGTITLWHLGNGGSTALNCAKLPALRAGIGGWVNSLAFSPDGKVLASAGEDGTIKLWDLTPAKQVAK